jgi:hypothetical protein
VLFFETYEPLSAAREAVITATELAPGFDTVVVSGVSGTIGAIAAQVLGKKLLIVRKPGVPTQARYCEGSKRESFPLVGEIGGRFIIFDDEICTGKTVRHILETLRANFYLPCGAGMADDGCEDADCDQCDYLECADRRDSEYNRVNAPAPEPYPVFVGLLTVKPYRAPKPWGNFGYMWSPAVLASQFDIRYE